MLLNVVTTNAHKLASARKHLSHAGIRVRAIKMETPEIQDLTGKEIASYSARYAADKLGQPVAVTDAGMYIKALGGFPGPFVKYTNHWLTVEDIERLMRGRKERRVELTDWLAFCEPGKKPIAFKTSLLGRMSNEPQGESPNPIDCFFVPIGYKRTLSTLTEKQRRALFAQHATNWSDLAKYLKKRFSKF